MPRPNRPCLLFRHMPRLSGTHTLSTGVCDSQAVAGNMVNPTYDENLYQGSAASLDPDLDCEPSQNIDDEVYAASNPDGRHSIIILTVDIRSSRTMTPRRIPFAIPLGRTHDYIQVSLLHLHPLHPSFYLTHPFLIHLSHISLTPSFSSSILYHIALIQSSITPPPYTTPLNHAPIMVPIALTIALLT